MAQSSVINGDGNNTNNWQRNLASVVKDLISEAVVENLEIETLFSDSGSGSGSDSSSGSVTIVDFGCAVGPSTFYAVQTVIEAIQHKYSQEGSLEFQVLFNDLIGNDFNTLFASLPNPRSYLAAGVPGSFYEKLFPSSSIYVAYSSNSVMWLSKAPEGLLVKGSPSWNPGKIHYTGASDAVVKAYEEQFEEDMEVFFRLRAQEIASGGMMMLLLPCVPHRSVQHHACIIYTFIESILMDMVKEGGLEQDQVDSFNIFSLFPRIEDMRSVIEKNGNFEIVKMEKLDAKMSVDPEALVSHIRAILDGTIADHFGKETADRLFAIAMDWKLELSRNVVSSEMGVAELLFAALKRKKN